jgi:predicted RNA binding protein YcfA (HicA-like mRNA interferase family)
LRLPRDVSGKDLARRLSVFGYEQTRQSGSHIRLTTNRNGTHHITVPAHESLRLGTLSSIVVDVAQHLGLDKETVVETLFK